MDGVTTTCPDCQDSGYYRVYEPCPATGKLSEVCRYPCPRGCQPPDEDDDEPTESTDIYVDHSGSD
jgi:hypothetical protein